MIQSEHKTNQLKQISPDKITRNPDNPRMFFRPQELNTLLASISRFGIQVPITVYQDGDAFFLIDGERRWRCATKLNLKTIPALVQEKPSPLDNLLLMFNIHALREQWDYFTIANKLPTVIDRFANENGHKPNEVELSEITGLTRGQIRRCNLLLDLPSEYRELLKNELELPKQRQKLSEDFFIEMERALKTVVKRAPDTVFDLDNVRNALIDKFKKNIIKNVTDFRKLSKIATSVSNLGIKQEKATNALHEIFESSNQTGIIEIYSEYFEIKYDERKLILNIESISDYLVATEEEQEIEITYEIENKLKHLKKLIEKVLEGRDAL